MSSTQGKAMGRVLLAGAIACVLAINVLLAGCGNNAQESTSESTRSEQVISDQSATVDDEHADYTAIETAYGTLYYPEQWQEYVTTEQVEDGDVLAVTFTATVNDASYKLFDIVIGGDGDNPAGTITDESGTWRNVYVQLDELELDESLDDTEQSRLYAMQEGINDVLDNLA